MPRLSALLFDKDGTLFDFQATWGRFHARFLSALADGDPQLHARLAEVTAFDTEQERFRPESTIIAASLNETVEVMREAVPHIPHDVLYERIRTETSAARQVAVTDLPALMAGLRSRGMKLGIATNDAEAPARSNLRSAGIETEFDFIAGYDSGFGAKPQTGMLDAFASHTGLAPDSIGMVGDSTHDLHAARDAGMFRIGVLTGVAEHDDLAPHSDLVLQDISLLPAWLDAQT